MKRRVFVGGAFGGLGMTGAYARPPQAKGGDIPTRTLGKTGDQIQIIAQGGSAWTCIPILLRPRRMSAGSTIWA
jgi:hypothetical protein